GEVRGPPLRHCWLLSDEMRGRNDRVDAGARGRLVERVHCRRNAEQLTHPGGVTRLDGVDADSGREHGPRPQLRRLTLVRSDCEILERDSGLEELMLLLRHSLEIERR